MHYVLLATYVRIARRLCLQPLPTHYPVGIIRNASYGLAYALTSDYYMIATWLPHDFYMITAWLPHDYHMITTWVPHDYHMITTWLPHDCHMITTWLLRVGLAYALTSDQMTRWSSRRLLLTYEYRIHTACHIPHVPHTARLAAAPTSPRYSSTATTYIVTKLE